MAVGEKVMKMSLSLQKAVMQAQRQTCVYLFFTLIYTGAGWGDVQEEERKKKRRKKNKLKEKKVARRAEDG